MSLRVCAALLCCAFAGAALAQKSASEVTDAQIKQYKATAENACLESGKTRGDPLPKVTEFCKCMTSVFEKNLTKSDWQQLYFLASQKRDKEEANVLGPHVTKLRSCRPPAPA
jgi:hypothetical protein